MLPVLYYTWANASYSSLTEPGLSRPCVPNGSHGIDLVPLPSVQPDALGACHMGPDGAVDAVAPVAEEYPEGHGGEARELGATVGALVVPWELRQGPHSLQVTRFLSRAHDHNFSRHGQPAMGTTGSL